MFYIMLYKNDTNHPVFSTSTTELDPHVFFMRNHYQLLKIFFFHHKAGKMQSWKEIPLLTARPPILNHSLSTDKQTNRTKYAHRDLGCIILTVFSPANKTCKIKTSSEVSILFEKSYDARHMMTQSEVCLLGSEFLLVQWYLPLCSWTWNCS